MDKVYALYQTDNWHSYDSQVLFCVCKTKEECLDLLWNKYGEDQKENAVLIDNEMLEELKNNDQTQSSGRNYEFEIEEFTLGEMYE